MLLKEMAHVWSSEGDFDEDLQIVLVWLHGESKDDNHQVKCVEYFKVENRAPLDKQNKMWYEAQWRDPEMMIILDSGVCDP